MIPPPKKKIPKLKTSVYALKDSTGFLEKLTKIIKSKTQPNNLLNIKDDKNIVSRPLGKNIK